MLNIVLVYPEIPPNTGNIMRLARNTGAHLHLIEPLGFALDDSRMRRAGLDYYDQARVETYADWESYLVACPDARRFTFSTKASRLYTEPEYQRGDHLIFGSETRGLPEDIRHSVIENQQLTLPMVADSRSLNLSNCVAIAIYEVWRQLDFAGRTQ